MIKLEKRQAKNLRHAPCKTRQAKNFRHAPCKTQEAQNTRFCKMPESNRWWCNQNGCHDHSARVTLVIIAAHNLVTSPIVISVGSYIQNIAASTRTSRGTPAGGTKSIASFFLKIAKNPVEQEISLERQNLLNEAAAYKLAEKVSKYIQFRTSVTFVETRQAHS